MRRGRGRHAAPLTAADRALLAAMFTDAAELRLAGADFCVDCDRHPLALCDQHRGDIGQVQAYRAMLRRWGIHV
jgi:hypothetical protein